MIPLSSLVVGVLITASCLCVFCLPFVLRLSVLDPRGIAESLKIGRFIGLKALFQALIYICGQEVLHKFQDWLVMAVHVTGLKY